MRTSDAQKHATKGEDPLFERVVSKDTELVVVDAWSKQEFKTLYSVKTSLFASTLGKPPVGTPDEYTLETRIDVVKGMGPTTYQILKENLGLHTLGNIIKTPEGDMDVMEATLEINGKKLTQGLTLRRVKAWAKALLRVGLPDVADVSEDEEHIIDESDATRCGSGSGGGGGEGGCGGGGSDGGSSDDDAWL
jgi:uncharacterized membrane protein YgcG